jgi:uncharacterized membrane protein SpoIIM required for sporulation
VSGDLGQGLAVSSLQFRAAREADWERLETLLGRVEKGRAGSLSDDDLFELPVLYRATLSSLSVARETSLDADLVAYLEALSTRAYFLLYGVHAPFFVRLGRFFAEEWPEAVRALWRETLVAVAITVAGAVAAYLLVMSDSGWFYAVIPADLANGRDPSADPATLRSAIYGTHGGLGLFATYLFTHNAQIAIGCFALGFAFGVPTVLLLLYNGCMIGAFLAVHVPKGLGFQFSAWLSIHGTTEIFAIILAGAAGLRIGMATAFPGARTRMASATAAGRTSAFVMLGVMVMLALAGLLEGIGRQVIRDDWARIAIGGTALAMWCAYFYLKPRARHG